MHLRPKSFATLLYLVEHRDRVVSKHELLQHIWPDVSVTEDVLVGCIGDIRRVLGNSDAVVRTVPKTGYQFSAEVAESGTRGSEPANPAPPPRRLRRWIAPVLLTAVLLAAFLAWWFRPVRVTEAGWWRFEEPVAGIIHDSSGFGNDGRITGTVKHTQDGPFKNALEFSGAGYVSGNGPGNGFPVKSGSFTIAAWLRVPDSPNPRAGGPVFHFGTPGREPRSNAHLFVTDDAKVCFGWGFGYGIACGQTSIADHQWHHVAGTYSSAAKRLSLYVDAADYARLQLSDPSALGHGAPWTIGYYQTGGNPFVGSLADVRIYGAGLSHPQIAALRSCSLAGQVRLPHSARGYFVPLYRATVEQISAPEDSNQTFEYSGFGKGGAEFAVSDGVCSLESLRGASLPSDLQIRAEVFLPAGTEAGPFFRAHRVGPGDPIEAPGFGGFWIRMNSAGEVAVHALSHPETAPATPLAKGDSPVLIHPSEWHTLEAEVKGSSLRVQVDGRFVHFTVQGRLAESVSVASLAAGSAAGIAMQEPPVPTDAVRIRSIQVTDLSRDATGNRTPAAKSPGS